jgi:aspartyl-tRNA synthetase
MINVPGGASMSRKEIDQLAEYIKTYRAKGLAWLTCRGEPRGSILKFLTPELTQASIERAGGVPWRRPAAFVADKNKVVFDALGQLRCEVARRAA